MKFSKKTIALAIVPALFISGCAPSSPPTPAMSQDAAYVAVAENLNKSYEEAKAKGFTGTYEEWVKLLELHQTNPQQAAQQASNQGFDGMDMLMAGAMGMMLGNMMSNGSYNSYRDRQRSYGSNAYTPASSQRLAAARTSEANAQRSAREAKAAAARAERAASRSSTASNSTASRSSSSVSRGGFGGAVSSGG